MGWVAKGFAYGVHVVYGDNDVGWSVGREKGETG